jgi:prevent-host-death family protein
MTTDGLEQLDHFSINEARDGLGTIVARAGYGDQRIVITRYGVPLALVVGLRDFDRLAKLDAENEEYYQLGDA